MINGTISRVSEGIVASADAIRVEYDLMRVTGSIEINTIWPGLRTAVGQYLILVPTDGPLTLGTAGNILNGITIAQNRAIHLIFVKALQKWVLAEGGAASAELPPGYNDLVQASYWTVSSNPTLVNERALSLLANGYVKSTGGEPSTVAIIPITDGGTGANNAPQARVNLGLGTVATININGDNTTYLSGDGVWRVPPVGSGSGNVPAGMVGIFLTACPAGWTRVTAFDGLFLRGGAAYGSVGGTVNHAHPAGALNIPGHTHSLTGLEAPRHGHNVGFGGRTEEDGYHQHVLDVDVIGETQLETGPTVHVDAGTSFWAVESQHKHAINFKSAGFTTLSDPDPSRVGIHSHGLAGVGGYAADEGPWPISGSVTPAAALTVSGTTGPQDHIPPFISVVYCSKN